MSPFSLQFVTTPAIVSNSPSKFNANLSNESGAKSFYLAFANKDSHPSPIQSMFYARSVLDKIMLKYAPGLRIGNRSAKMPHIRLAVDRC